MRLFIALWPSEKALETISLLNRPEQPGIRWVPSKNWHITLTFLGEIDLEIALEHFDSISIPTTKTQACLGPETKLIKNRILYIPVQGVKPLFDCVYDATKEITLSPQDPLAHLTLARCRIPKKELVNLTGQKISLCWQVSEITLVQSTLGAQGATYNILAKKPTTA